MSVSSCKLGREVKKLSADNRCWMEWMDKALGEYRSIRAAKAREVDLVAAADNDTADLSPFILFASSFTRFAAADDA